MGVAPRTSGGVKKRLASYDATAAQGTFTYTVPDGYRYARIIYSGYINESGDYSVLVDLNNAITYGTLSMWYGTSNYGTLRGRRFTYDPETRILSFGGAGRFEYNGYAASNNICPVHEIWGWA